MGAEAEVQSRPLCTHRGLSISLVAIALTVLEIEHLQLDSRVQRLRALPESPTGRVRPVGARESPVLVRDSGIICKLSDAVLRGPRPQVLLPEQEAASLPLSGQDQSI